MASTIAIYTGDGTTTDFTVPFDYLAKKFVKVSVGLTELEGGDYGDTSKGYYFLDKTTVRLKTAPQVGAEVTIRRYTSATDRIVSFKDASILKAKDLDTSSIQTIHIAEEGRDVINDALIVDKYGNWDAKGHRIVNVGDPVDDGDSVNFKTYKADSMGAHQSRVEAEKARDRAVEAETNAKASEVKAKESETNAKESETNAKVSEDIAVSASEHADAVKTENEKLLVETKKSEASAKESANTATTQATISTNKANEAMGYAMDAKVSEDNAKDSEVAAEGSAELSTQKANEAEAYAMSASRSATEADASAKNSANSASTATQQATLATQKATEAETSADKSVLAKDSAKVSETNAKVSETNSKVSETNAKNSETEATAQAERAKSYADQAASGQVNADWDEAVPTSKAFIKNKPKLFSGSYVDLTDKPTLGTLSSKNSLAYSELTGVPTEFTPKSHTHGITQITGLQSVLDGKQSIGDYATTVDLTEGLDGKANRSHTHTVSQITDMPKVVLSVNGQAPNDDGNISPSQTGCLPLTGGTLTGGVGHSILNISATSGTVTLTVNRIHKMNISGNTTFLLPAGNASVFTQIKVMVNVNGTPSINWGTNHFFNNKVPSIKAGQYDFYFDYDPVVNAWVAGAVPKGV